MATKRNVEAGPTAQFKVLSNLMHDGENYAPGDTVDLSEAQAVELGPLVVEPVPAEKK